MKPLLTLTSLALAIALLCPSGAFAQRSQYEEMVAKHAQANGVPVTLVHRVIIRESRYDASLVGRGGTIGLMQIKLATARSLGYTGTAEGLRDPDTNLAYAAPIVPPAAITTGPSVTMPAAITTPPNGNGRNRASRMQCAVTSCPAERVPGALHCVLGTPAKRPGHAIGDVPASTR
jgi:soluble lytic murein transglycosylase-like protein